MKTKLFLEMDWQEFYERYTKNFEEFVFWYKDYKINICYGSNGSFSYNIVKDNKIIQNEEFSTPIDLLNNAKFEGRLLKDIYKELY